MKPDRIFLSPPHMCGREQDFVRDAFEGNYIAPLGPHVQGFEQEIKEYLDASACAAVSSGTAALHLALHLCGVGPEDKVLCSDLTFIGSVSPVLYQNAVPIFVDAHPLDWNMDPDAAYSLLKKHSKTDRPIKALILVHLYGRPADIDVFRQMCRDFNVTLIEDAAESLGATYKGKHTGTFGRFGVLSFNGNKIITTSGGGMLICREEEERDHAVFLASQARDPAPHYQHSTIGYNYRMSNILAAIGRGQLTVLQKRVEKKQWIYAEYKKRLNDLTIIEFPEEIPGRHDNKWLTCILFGPDAARGAVVRETVRCALEETNIESRPVWKPMHLQPVFQDYEYSGGAVGEELFHRGLCLPSGTTLTEADLEKICGIIRKTVSA